MRLIALIFTLFISYQSAQGLIGGTPAVLGQFPWHVTIASFNSQYQLVLCNGIFINDEWVLTTASCLFDLKYAGIRAGTVDDDFLNDGRYIYSFQIVPHENFDPKTLKNDIGLAKILNPITFNENIQPISLAQDRAGSNVEAVISAWAKNDEDGYTLQYGTVTTIDNGECQAIYGSDVVTDNIICTRGSQSPCVGDGGAALVINSDSDPVAIGLFSFTGSLQCGGTPAGYTRISSYRSWIRGKTGI